MAGKKPDTKLLGRKAELPASPDEAVLDRVPNPHPDTHYAARFTVPEFTTLCPVTGQPDFAHIVIDYVPNALAGGIEIAEALSWPRFAIMAPSTRIAPSPSASASRGCSSRTTCASAATGIRAAAFPSTCSGRRARCPRASGCPIRASRPIAAEAERSPPGASRSAHPFQAKPRPTRRPGNSSVTGLMCRPAEVRTS